SVALREGGVRDVADRAVTEAQGPVSLGRQQLLPCERLNELVTRVRAEQQADLGPVELPSGHRTVLQQQPLVGLERVQARFDQRVDGGWDRRLSLWARIGEQREHLLDV